MLAALNRALTSRVAGPTATAAALVLAILLAVTWTAGRAERATLKARLAEAAQQSERSASLWKAQLAACHAAAAGGQRLTAADYSAPTDPDEAARRLLTQGPEGIDVCARMESADQAVLETLK